jgi:hypothetical protein
VPVGTVADLENDNKLVLISDSQNIKSILHSVGIDEDKFDTLFVKAENGEYKEIYGVEGIPYIWKKVFKITFQDKEKLDILRQEGLKVCALRGHAMGEWKHSKQSAYAYCKRCGRGIFVNINPLPNDINIRGEALAVNCEY